MKQYQPLPSHILSFAGIFHSRILIYAGSNIDEKVFEKNMVI